MGAIYLKGILYGGGSPQVPALPEPSAEELGNIYQYVGETSDKYVTGYFYICEEVTPVTDPKTYKWTQKNVQDGGDLSKYWTSDSGHDNSLEAATVSEIQAILNA